MALEAEWQQDQEERFCHEEGKKAEKPLRFKLRKTEIVRHKKTIDEIISTGKKINLKHLVIFYKGSERSQIGILLSRRIKKAVERNRIKRYIREAYRLTKHKIKHPKQIIFLLKSSSRDFNFKYFKEIIETHLVNNHAE